MNIMHVLQRLAARIRYGIHDADTVAAYQDAEALTKKLDRDSADGLRSGGGQVFIHEPQPEDNDSEETE